MQSNYGAFRVCVRTRIIQPRRGDLNFRPVQIRFICQPQLTVWRGAPCSPQRTWAENDVFECFYSIPEQFSLEQLRLRRAKAFEGASPHRFRPTYAGANVGHPSHRRFLSLHEANLDRSEVQAAPYGAG